MGLTRRTQSVLSRYSWTGNVRELENVLLRACTMTREKVIDDGDLPKRLQEGKLEITGREDELVSLEEIQRRHARRVLDAMGGNKLQAAGISGISRAAHDSFAFLQPNDHVLCLSGFASLLKPGVLRAALID